MTINQVKYERFFTQEIDVEATSSWRHLLLFGRRCAHFICKTCGELHQTDKRSETVKPNDVCGHICQKRPKRKHAVDGEQKTFKCSNFALFKCASVKIEIQCQFETFNETELLQHQQLCRKNKGTTNRKNVFASVLKEACDEADLAVDLIHQFDQGFRDNKTIKGFTRTHEQVAVRNVSVFKMSGSMVNNNHLVYQSVRPSKKSHKIREIDHDIVELRLNDVTALMGNQLSRHRLEKILKQLRLARIPLVPKLGREYRHARSNLIQMVSVTRIQGAKRAVNAHNSDSHITHINSNEFGNVMELYMTNEGITKKRFEKIDCVTICADHGKGSLKITASFMSAKFANSAQNSLLIADTPCQEDLKNVQKALEVSNLEKLKEIAKALECPIVFTSDQKCLKYPLGLKGPTSSNPCPLCYSVKKYSRDKETGICSMDQDQCSKYYKSGQL